jgi:predicted nucleic acid-binding protein
MDRQIDRLVCALYGLTAAEIRIVAGGKLSVKIYLDVSCLNRPFDDQSQVRIHLEAEAVVLILERLDRGEWTQLSSEMAVIEIGAIPDVDRRERVQLLLPAEKSILKLTRAVWERAAELEALGFKPADAVHIAAAEESGADVFLSCDDRLCRRTSDIGAN